MVEARAAPPACRGLERIERLWWDSDRADRETKAVAYCRLLRALLPSVQKLEHFVWDPVYEPLIIGAKGAPRLKDWELILTKSAAPSVEVWETMTELEVLRLDMWKFSEAGHYTDLGSFFLALNRGVAFQRLHKLGIAKARLDLDEWAHVLNGLVGAGCASRLTCLNISRSNLCPKAMAVVAALLSQDCFPMLHTLLLSTNENIRDEGVAHLARGLLDAPRTRLIRLKLGTVGMGDGGMASLAGVISEGRFERLKIICLNEELPMHYSNAITDEGVGVLARAVGDTGLPMLSEFWADGLWKVTRSAMEELKAALVSKCPLLIVEVSTVTWAGDRNKGEEW